jgi:hypothetical protein
LLYGKDAATGTVVDTVAISYSNASGGNPSALSVTHPTSDFSVANGFSSSIAASMAAGGVGTFSAIVGNANNATDVLFPSSVPEPCSIVSLIAGSILVAAKAHGRRRKARASRDQ